MVQSGRIVRDVRHLAWFLPKLPLDIAIVRESIHKRNEYEAPCPLMCTAGAANRVAPAQRKSYWLNELCK
jgi:hypothetical protein